MKEKNIRIGLVQMSCQIGDKEPNVNKAANLISGMPEGTNIACLPEFFNTGYNLDIIGEGFYELAETIPGETTEQLGKLAREKNLAVLGNIPERDNEQETVLYDTTFIIDSNGELKGRYRKTHLFPDESRYFKPGNMINAVDLAFCRIGTATCFDHAFPEIFSTLALDGAGIIFIPSAVPVGYEYLLDIRTRARAQDNQLWVAAVNRVGTEGEIRYCGLSKVVNPKGMVTAEASTVEEEVLVHDIDLDLIHQERKQEPSLRLRRPDLYR